MGALQAKHQGIQQLFQKVSKDAFSERIVEHSLQQLVKVSSWICQQKQKREGREGGVQGLQHSQIGCIECKRAEPNIVKEVVEVLGATIVLTCAPTASRFCFLGIHFTSLGHSFRSLLQGEVESQTACSAVFVAVQQLNATG